MPQDTKTPSTRKEREKLRKRKHRRIVLSMIGAAVLLLAIIAQPWRWLGGGDVAPLPETPQTPAETPDFVTEEFLPVNEYSRPGTPLEQVNGIVVHYVGNPNTTAEQNRSYFANLAQTGETSASSHYVIGMEGEIIQCVPLDEIAYCSGERNADTISIECCHPDETGKFTDATLESLRTLLRYLIDHYGLQREDVIRHYDVSGKECPLYFVKHPDEWEAFKDTLF